jgi:hypothetical protein
MGVLASAPSALTIDEISRQFSQGRQVDRRVAQTILALARLGHITAPESADRFALRGVG